MSARWQGVEWWMSDNLPIRKRVTTLTLAWDLLTIDTRGFLSISSMHTLSNTCTDTHTQTPMPPVWSRTVPPTAASWRVPMETDPCSIKASVMGCRPRLGTWPSPSGLSTTQPGEGEPCRQPIAFLEEGILAPGQPDGHWCSRHESYHWVMLLKWDIDTQWESKLLPG